MPVQDFLDDFLPSTEVPDSRREGDFTFSQPSVLLNEVEFVSLFTFIHVHIMTLIKF
jgi:hypothetical protein